MVENQIGTFQAVTMKLKNVLDRYIMKHASTDTQSIAIASCTFQNYKNAINNILAKFTQMALSMARILREALSCTLRIPSIIHIGLLDRETAQYQSLSVKCL